MIVSNQPTSSFFPHSPVKPDFAMSNIFLGTSFFVVFFKVSYSEKKNYFSHHSKKDDIGKGYYCNSTICEEIYHFKYPFNKPDSKFQSEAGFIYKDGMRRPETKPKPYRFHVFERNGKKEIDCRMLEGHKQCDYNNPSRDMYSNLNALVRQDEQILAIDVVFRNESNSTDFMVANKTYFKYTRHGNITNLSIQELFKCKEAKFSFLFWLILILIIIQVIIVALVILSVLVCTRLKEKRNTEEIRAKRQKIQMTNTDSVVSMIERKYKISK